MRASLGVAVVHGAGGVERAGGNQEPLEEDALLEPKVSAHGVRDVGGRDLERYGDVGLLQHVVDLEVAHDAALFKLCHLDGKVCLLANVPLLSQHVPEAVLDRVGQVLELLGLGVVEPVVVPQAGDLELAVDLVPAVPLPLPPRPVADVGGRHVGQQKVFAHAGRGAGDGAPPLRGLHLVGLEGAALGPAGLEGE